MLVARVPRSFSLTGNPSLAEDVGDPALLGVGFAIKAYSRCLVSRKPFWRPGKIRLVYSQTEEVDRVEDIVNPVFRYAMEYYRPKTPLEVVFSDEFPGHKGLGGASGGGALLTGLLLAMESLEGNFSLRGILQDTLSEIVYETIREVVANHPEEERLRGIDGAPYSIHGGISTIRRSKQAGYYLREPVFLPETTPEEFEKRLVLAYSAGLLGPESHPSDKAVHTAVSALSHAMLSHLRLGAWKDVGSKMTDIGYLWLRKTPWEQRQVIFSAIDTALVCGALGAVRDGAWLVCLVEPEERQRLIDGLVKNLSGVYIAPEEITRIDWSGAVTYSC